MQVMTLCEELQVEGQLSRVCVFEFILVTPVAVPYSACVDARRGLEQIHFAQDVDARKFFRLWRVRKRSSLRRQAFSFGIIFVLTYSHHARSTNQRRADELGHIRQANGSVDQLDTH